MGDKYHLCGIKGRKHLVNSYIYFFKETYLGVKVSWLFAVG
jgi:hypothetical protein